MAQKKSAARTTKSTASSKKTAAKAAPPVKPIRREVAGVVFLALGIIAFLGYFPFTEGAWLIDGLCFYVFKGMVGSGFIVLCPCLIWAAWSLIFHRGRPVLARVICILLIPVFFGAIVHLFATVSIGHIDIPALQSLYYGGRDM